MVCLKGKFLFISICWDKLQMCIIFIRNTTSVPTSEKNTFGFLLSLLIYFPDLKKNANIFLWVVKWLWTPVIPATWEGVTGGLDCSLRPARVKVNGRPWLKHKLKMQKGLGPWLKVEYLPSKREARPWVQYPVPHTHTKSRHCCWPINKFRGELC
jgi:hypothetical protein